MSRYPQMRGACWLWSAEIVAVALRLRNFGAVSADAGHRLCRVIPRRHRWGA